MLWQILFLGTLVKKKKLSILRLNTLDMAEVVFDKNYLITAQRNEDDLLNTIY